MNCCKPLEFLVVLPLKFDTVCILVLLCLELRRGHPLMRDRLSLHVFTFCVSGKILQALSEKQYRQYRLERVSIKSIEYKISFNNNSDSNV